MFPALGKYVQVSQPRTTEQRSQVMEYGDELLPFPSPMLLHRRTKTICFCIFLRYQFTDTLADTGNSQDYEITCLDAVSSNAIWEFSTLLINVRMTMYLYQGE